MKNTYGAYKNNKGHWVGIELEKEPSRLYTILYGIAECLTGIGIFVLFYVWACLAL